MLTFSGINMYFSCWLRLPLLLMLLVPNLLYANSVYKVMTEEFHPFGYYQENGHLTGVAVEITRLLFEEVGHPDNIQVLPWARAIQNINHKNNHVLFAMARTAEREEKYHWVGPILSDNIYLFQKSDNPIFYQQINQAKEAGFIAVTREFPEQTFLEDLSFSNLVLTHNPKQSVKMLMTNRVPLMAAGAAVMHELVISSGYKPENFKRTGIRLFSTDLYIAFSKNIPEQEVQRWQAGLDKLMKQENYQEILTRYHFD